MQLSKKTVVQKILSSRIINEMDLLKGKLRGLWSLESEKEDYLLEISPYLKI